MHPRLGAVLDLEIQQLDGLPAELVLVVVGMR